ncbi:MAG: hypothetical protein LIR46_02880 [Bacteroidota bacterium]|nr:hypothetical protein [Bacteroidota bacterium]
MPYDYTFGVSKVPRKDLTDQVIAWMPFPEPYEPIDSVSEEIINEAIKIVSDRLSNKSKYCHPIEKNLNKRCRQTGYFCSECNKTIGYMLQVQCECGCLIDWNEIDDQSIS